MALVESILIPLGSDMPEFTLKTPAGDEITGSDAFGPKGLLVAFTCNHCPYAIAVWPRLIRIAAAAKAKGIETLAINPNIHPKYPDDAPERMLEKIAEWKIPFPYLVDETQSAAKAFKAQCTPDLYLFGSDKKLVYHGRIDDNWEDESKVTSRELETAVDALAAGEAAPETQRPSMGCSIKWQ